VGAKTEGLVELPEKRSKRKKKTTAQERSQKWKKKKKLGKLLDIEVDCRSWTLMRGKKSLHTGRRGLVHMTQGEWGGENRKNPKYPFNGMPAPAFKRKKKGAARRVYGWTIGREPAIPLMGGCEEESRKTTEGKELVHTGASANV